MKNSNPKTFSSLEEARTYYASLSRKLQAKKEDALFKLAKINAEMENLEKNFREYSLALPLCDQKRYYLSMLIDMDRTSKKGAPENTNYTVADIDGLYRQIKQTVGYRDFYRLYRQESGGRG